MESQRVFFLTGAASGIGKHLVGALAGRGHRVFATDVNEAGLAALRGEQERPGAVVTCPLDVSRAEAWEKALDAAEQAFGPVDVLMNIAGILVEKVLPNRPLEVALPLSRALLARAANAVPAAALALAPTLTQKGLKAQARIAATSRKRIQTKIV